MDKRAGYDLEECLDAIDPSSLNYEEWVSVGMALHAEGYDWSLWDSWSQRDPARYHSGECRNKWASFGRSSTEVTGGTLVQIAKDNGWRASGFRSDDPGEALSWDMLEVSDETDIGWIEPADIEEPKNWIGYKDTIRYLEALWEPSEIVGFVTDAWLDDDGRWKPGRKGSYTMTAGEIIERLNKYNGDFASAIGEPNECAGAWIRINALDGKGVRNDNVSEFKYALVESDNVEIDKQKGIIDKMQLPVAALVHSGNKSLHAIVKVDAKNYDEYRKKVDYLYTVCKRYGLSPDTQNKNPSRLSRMPGVMRNGQKQWLVATNVGKDSWDEWKDWIEEINDDLPEITEDEDLDTIEMKPEQLVKDVLYPGDKMLLAGPSKAGKSYLLIELCIALATGSEWLGHPCKEGKVLYINLELKTDNRKRRFKLVRDAMGADPNLVRKNIHYLDLRGKSAPLEQLSNSIIRRATTHKYHAIVIDPIYKVMMGDENSAEAVGKFCNQLDKLAESLDAAVLYCHHHSKGSQGQKQSMDRASGSGVFTRDADVQIDMIELELTEELMKQQEGSAVCEACARFMDKRGISWHDDVSPDDQVMEAHMLSATKDLVDKHSGSKAVQELLSEVYETRKTIKAKSAWRIEGTFRELPRTEPLNIWFDWPVHKIDDLKVLSDLKSEGEKKRKRSAKVIQDARKKSAQKAQSEKVELVREAMEMCVEDGVEPTRSNILERIKPFNEKEITSRQLREWTSPRSKWCPIKVDPENEDSGLLVDTDLKDLMNGF